MIEKYLNYTSQSDFFCEIFGRVPMQNAYINQDQEKLKVEK